MLSKIELYTLGHSYSKTKKNHLLRSTTHTSLQTQLICRFLNRTPKEFLTWEQDNA